MLLHGLGASHHYLVHQLKHAGLGETPRPECSHLLQQCEARKEGNCLGFNNYLHRQIDH